MGCLTAKKKYFYCVRVEQLSRYSQVLLLRLNWCPPHMGVSTHKVFPKTDRQDTGAHHH